MSIERILAGITRFTALVLLGIAGSAQAASRIPQLAEDNASTRYLPETSGLLAKPATRVCEKGARWIRIGFRELTLGRYDSLVLESDGGDRYTFEGGRWND